MKHLVSLFLGICCASLSLQAINHISAASGDWAVPETWDAGGEASVPTVADNVYVRNNHTVFISATDSFEAGQLLISNHVSYGDGTLLLNGNLTVDSTSTIGSGPNSARLMINHGATYIANGAFNVSGNQNHSTVTISKGGSLLVNSTGLSYIGTRSGGTEGFTDGLVSLNGGRLDVAGTLLIGSAQNDSNPHIYGQLHINSGNAVISKIILGGTPGDILSGDGHLLLSPSAKFTVNSVIEVRKTGRITFQLDSEGNDLDAGTATITCTTPNTFHIDAGMLGWRGESPGDSRNITLLRHSSSTNNFNNASANITLLPINHNPEVYQITPVFNATAMYVTVTYLVDAPILLSSPPPSMDTPLGQTRTLSVDVLGYGLSYQWQASYDNGITWVNINGATASTLSLRNEQASENGTLYRCQVTDSASRQVTSPATQVTLFGKTSLRLWGWNAHNKASTPSPIKKISTAINHTLALHEDGSLSAWGDNIDGQCDIPAIPEGKHVIDIATRGEFNLALLNDHSVITWGANSYRIVESPPDGLDGVQKIAAGYGAALALKSDGTLLAWGEPNTPQSISGVSGIAAGSHHYLALLANGTLSSWGYNFSGQLDIPDDIGSISKIVAGSDHTQVLLTNGSIRAFGDNGYGQLNIPSDLGQITQLVCGAQHIIALKADGTLAGWGRNLESQLPPVGYTPHSPIVQISASQHRTELLHEDGSISSWGEGTPGLKPVPAIPESHAIVQAASGYAHSLLLHSDGGISSWGCNLHEECDTPAHNSPIRMIAAGDHFSLALHDDGSLSAWGDNSQGQLGIPQGLSDVTQIAAGRAHGLAVKSDGALLLWGDNSYGQLNLPGPKPITSIAAGRDFSLALHQDGSLSAWGDNTDGQLNVPSSASGIRQIAAGATHALALKTDGSLIAWGNNTYKQLNTPRIPAGRSIVKIAAGTNHSIALLDDGSALAWGENFANQVSPIPADAIHLRLAAGGRLESLAITDTTPLEIITQPSNLDPENGDSVSYHVRTYGGFDVRYQWQVSSDGGLTWQNIEGATDARLLLPDYTGDRDLLYRVIVSSGNSVIVSNPARLGPGTPPYLNAEELLAYALSPNMDTQGNTEHLPKVTLNTEGKLEITFTPLRTELHYIVEASSDLHTWIEIEEINPEDIGNEVTISDTETNAPRRFLRLKIIQR